MNRISPESPERRAERREGGDDHVRRLGRLSWWPRAKEILHRIAVGVWSDGFIHAGNLAYLSLFSLFPFFIVAAAIGSLFSTDAETLAALRSFMQTLPPGVAKLLEQPIEDVLASRTGWLLWVGALVGLWTVGSFIETIRDVFRRAYGTQFSRPFWHYRLGSVALIFASVVLTLFALVLQGILTAAEQIVYRLVPIAQNIGDWIGWTRWVSGAVMFGGLYLLFFSVTPSRYRFSSCPKWPGALFTTLWWTAATAALPAAIDALGGYARTYGSLATVMVALFFFYVVGLGITMAAQLNAALAEGDAPGVRNAAEAGAEPAIA